jgi:hypothetical protein
VNDNSEKALRTYAYLTASLRTDASVADIYDCLLPFVTDSIANRPSEPVSIDKVATDLQAIGLQIPMYALQQMLPRLVSRGIIEWNNLSHTHIPTQGIADRKSEFAELPQSFAEIEPKLAAYAKNLGVDSPLVGDSWSDALIAFLKSNYSGQRITPFTFAQTIVANSPERQEFYCRIFPYPLSERR